MKKIILSSVILFGAILLVTGCSLSIGNKTLSCDEEASGVEINITTKFSGNKIQSMSLKYGMDLSTYSDAQINLVEKQDLCKSVKSAMSGMSDAFGNCKQAIENKQLSVTATIDISKVKGYDIDEKSTFSDVKKSLEKSGFDCTEK